MANERLTISRDMIKRQLCSSYIDIDNDLYIGDYGAPQLHASCLPPGIKTLALKLDVNR
jgi:hypothetical protein